MRGYNKTSMDTRIDYSHPPDPAAAGLDSQAIQPLSDLFDRMLAEGLHPAAQMVVLKDGQVIFDRAAGQVNGKPVTPETPFYGFSVSKAFTGMCVHRLIEAGKVSLDAPVAEYWPAFAQKGKGEVTIRQVFLHLAGVPAIHRTDQIPLWPSWKLTMAAVARLPLEYPPGTKNAYHAVTYGFILGEVVRRVSGLRIDRYFDQHFVRPLGLKNTWLKVPANQLKRVPELVCGAEDQETLVRVFNLRPIRRALIPAASLHSSAREMAIFYQMLLNQGRYGGVTFVRPETVAQATSLGYAGMDVINQRYSMWAYGFHLGGRATMPEEGESSFGDRSTQHTFGHMGNRSSMAWADSQHRLVVTFTCNRLLPYDDTRRRWISLNNAVWDAIGV